MNSFDQASDLRSTLTERLTDQIKREGPISFRDWMEAALYDPQDGYYCRPGIERWGRAGDYRTSPERSPIFATTFARYFVSLYEALDKPASWTIAEIGTGAGNFAEGVLDTLRRRFPEVFAATNYLVDEASASSCSAAQARLMRFANQTDFRPFTNVSSFDHGVIFSNELLDAFPVHRVTMRDGELYEFYLGLNEAGQFTWTIGPLSNSRLSDYFEFVGVQLADGQTAEINLAIEDWLTNVAARLRNGYVVTVDYGAEARELYGDSDRRQGTLRAFRRHRFADDVLALPGEQDITTTIDWTFVRKIGEKLGFETVQFQGQDQFLLSSGLLEELELMVAEAENEGLKLQLRTNAREMILPGSMGAGFQVLVQKRVVSRTDRG